MCLQASSTTSNNAKQPAVDASHMQHLLWSRAHLLVRSCGRFQPKATVLNLLFKINQGCSELIHLLEKEHGCRSHATILLVDLLFRCKTAPPAQLHVHWHDRGTNGVNASGESGLSGLWFCKQESG